MRVERRGVGQGERGVSGSRVRGVEGSGSG